MSVSAQSEKRWLKAELHAHCSLDPIDYRICQHTPEELIAYAAKLRYDVLAITCHDLDVWSEELSDYASSLGITLIPGMEVTTERTRHTLVYNFHAKAEELNTLSKIRSRSRNDTLVIAPHPFFPGRTCLRNRLGSNLDLFDAIECSGFYTRTLDFNHRSEKIAANRRKPLVGNGDVHYLWQLGRTFTWIYSEPGVLPIINAVKQGLVRLQRSPLTWSEAIQWWTHAFWRYVSPVNPAPKGDRLPVGVPGLNEIENGRCFGTAQESVEP
ncbi:MAG: hypothetical protein GXX84_09740 [Acidobacteria bacterium]|nr:hypothetical protein [Acidobacteriota bacterium]